MNKYEEVSTAGEGAYGVVLKCRHRTSGELVAVKKFRENEAEDAEAARVMQREIEILGALKHENIVGTREVFREGGVLHIVFEFVEQCLIDILDAHPSGLDSERTRQLVRQLTRAVEHCHANHIIHRDVKPDNVLVGATDDSLRLCDFGSACRIAPAGGEPLTDYAATRWYRAPELLVRFDDYGPGVDVWALGCVAAEMLTGRPLFPGQSDLDQLFMIDNALGPLTPRQNERCMDLTGFVKFPKVVDRETVEKRMGASASEQELRFLARALAVDPQQRMTAKTALSLPWLRAGAAPALGVGVGLAPAVAPCRLAPQVLRRSLEESVPTEDAEESIVEESIREDWEGDEMEQQASASTTPCEGALRSASARRSPALSASASGSGVGIAGAPGRELPCEDIHDSIHEECRSQVFGVGSTFQTGGWHAESLGPVGESVVDEESIVRGPPRSQPTDSLAAVDESLASNHHDQCEDTVMEEVIDCHEPEPAQEERRPPPRLAGPPLSGRGDGGRLQNPHIRPVSRGSARSSLTPLAS